MAWPERAESVASGQTLGSAFGNDLPRISNRDSCPTWNLSRPSAPAVISSSTLHQSARIQHVTPTRSIPGVHNQLSGSQTKQTSLGSQHSPAQTTSLSPSSFDCHPTPVSLDAPCTEDVHEYGSGTAPPGPPPLDEFEQLNSDIIVRQPAGELRLLQAESRSAQLHVNTGQEHAFAGPLFSGKIAVYIRGLPGQPQGHDVFANRRRQSWVVVQGRFKQPVATSECDFMSMSVKPRKALEALQLKWMKGTVLQACRHAHLEYMEWGASMPQTY
jgi:hypothetical protein